MHYPVKCEYLRYKNQTLMGLICEPKPTTPNTLAPLSKISYFCIQVK